MTKTINVAMIGCGRVAGHHTRSIRKVSNVQLVAVCDLVEEKAKELASSENVSAYINYHDMFAKHPEIDVVGICTPSGMHYEHSLEMIQQYQKHVVIEKPTVMRISKGLQLSKAAAQHKLKIFPVFQYRFNKSVQFVRKATQSKEMGDLVLGTIRLRWCRPQRYYDRAPWRGTYALDGGALTNQGVHLLDLLRYLAGEVKWVYADIATLGANIEVEDTGIVILEFENGGRGVIEITTAARPDDFESSISILGSKGLAMVGGWATNELLTYSPKPDEEEKNSEIFPDVYGFGHQEIYSGVYNALANMGKPSVEFEDAMKSIQLLHAIYHSAENHERIYIKDREESKFLGITNEELANLYRTPKL